MSLHNLARNVQSAGRGDDKVLVHMTPGEVKGLQSLAMAHGGSLTINPHTGLPEAGFLSALLPLIAGFALGPAGFGLFQTAAGAGLAVGAGTAAVTGDLKKGLMAGIGAYGGAGLGQGLMASGSQAAGAQAAGTAPNWVVPATPGAEYTAGMAEANAKLAQDYALNSQAGIDAAAKTPFTTSWKGLTNLGTEAGRTVFMDAVPTSAMYSAAAPLVAEYAKPKDPPKTNTGMIRPYEFSREVNPGVFDTGAPIYAEQPGSSAEKTYFTDKFTALEPYKAPGPEYKAARGGLASFAVGGPVETMSAENAVGQNLVYPQSGLQTAMYSNPMIQRPVAENVIKSGVDTNVDPYTGEQRFAEGGTPTLQKRSPGYKYSYNPDTLEFTQISKPVQVMSTPLFSQYGGNITRPLGWTSEVSNTASGGRMQPAMGMSQPQQPMYQNASIQPYQNPDQQLGLGGFYNDMNSQLSAMGYAAGGMSHLGDYSDGGRLLKGPGDGVSDSIPAVIGNRQPARLADGEFVVPARIVSELGNGSTEAGAKKLYAMMDRVQNARRKTTGKEQVARNTRADKLLPA